LKVRKQKPQVETPTPPFTAYMKKNSERIVREKKQVPGAKTKRSGESFTHMEGIVGWHPERVYNSKRLKKPKVVEKLKVEVEVQAGKGEATIWEKIMRRKKK